MSERAQPLLEAVRVTKSFGRVRALSGPSIALRPGELVGLVGPDGAGKTSLIRALMGLTTVDSGTVHVDGVSWDRASRTAREALGYMPQQYSLYADLSVDENLTFFGQLFGLSRSAFEQRRARLLGLTRLDAARDRRAGALSGGMYKKLAVACALLHSPRALVLDEPTNGVDPVSRRELWSLLYEFIDDGVGILVATPYMDEASRCSRLLLLSEGAVLAEGTPSALVSALEEPVIELAAGTSPAIVAELEASPAVVAVTPMGDSVRVVLRVGGADDVMKMLAGAGIGSRPARPDLEDLFLARMQRRSAGAAS